MQTQTCFLLSYLKYGDHDAVLHCFSEENGFTSFFVKGIYTTKNKKKPYLFPLNRLIITTSKSNSENNILKVSKIEMAPDHYDFNVVAMNSILFFTADFLHQVLRDESANHLLFNEIESLREEVSTQNYDGYLSFIFRFLEFSGIAPLPSKYPFLNPESGRFEEQISHTFFNNTVSLVWKRFLDAEQAYNIRLKRDERSAFLDSLMIYCQYHINGFYIPKSLAVVRQIFE
ncbi:DNA repair protein RecO [Kaistella carnis]|nr:recombination protein O N-terminal domain-containing protein [Kaistella carnis]